MKHLGAYNFLKLFKGAESLTGKGRLRAAMVKDRQQRENEEIDQLGTGQGWHRTTGFVTSIRGKKKTNIREG